MKVLQSATLDPVIQITPDFGGDAPNKKEAAPRSAALCRQGSWPGL